MNMRDRELVRMSANFFPIDWIDRYINLRATSPRMF